MDDYTYGTGLHKINPQNAVLEAKEMAGGICALARELEINKGHVSRAVNHGYVSPMLKRALDIPVYTNVPICDECGIAHTYDCKKQYTIKRKGRKSTRKRIRVLAPDAPQWMTSEQVALYRQRVKDYGRWLIEEMK